MNPNKAIQFIVFVLFCNVAYLNIKIGVLDEDPEKLVAPQNSIKGSTTRLVEIPAFAPTATGNADTNANINVVAVPSSSSLNLVDKDKRNPTPGDGPKKVEDKKSTEFIDADTRSVPSYTNKKPENNGEFIPVETLI